MQQSFHCFAQVGQEMPAIGDLMHTSVYRLNGFGIRAGPIPRDELDGWVASQPGRDTRRLASGQ